MVSAYTQGAGRRHIILSVCLLLALVAPVAAAATTELHVKKIAADGVTVIDEKTVDYRWLEANRPIQGDGVTHYYHQGPVFEGDMWNPEEDTNVLEKDMGAVKGTDLKDICELVGGMGEEDAVRVKAVDGLSKMFPYRNVYEPESRQGPMVITWYRAEDGYVPDYYTGMRLVFFADTSTNPDGVHAFGVWDMHECFNEEYWYFYNGEYPTTTGLSVQYVSEITIYSDEEPTGSIYVTSTPAGATVFIDDEDTGSVTPCTLSGIEVGSHSVRVELEGFAPSDEEWFTVVANSATDAKFDDLTPKTKPDDDGSSNGGGSVNGSIAITSVPMNASIYLDGNSTGIFTDATLEDLTPGEHTIKLVLPGYPNMTRTVTAEAGKRSHLDLIFEDVTAGEDAAGWIAITSIPTNASIYLDGSATGMRTNATLEDVPVGEHTIELMLPGYQNATRSVTVEESERITLGLILSPTGDEPGVNATERDETTPGRPAPGNTIEAFIEAVFTFFSGLLAFFGMGEGTTTPLEPEDTQAPESGTPVPTNTPVLPAQTPGEAQIVKNHSGGLYIESYPSEMTITIDNKKLVQKTPHVVYGLREGLHTINVEESDSGGKKEESSYRFEALRAWVYPDTIAPVSLDGLTNRRWKTIQIGSETYQGERFTANGFFPASTIPGDAEIEGQRSWITVFWNETYRSYAIPPGIEDGGEHTVEQRDEDTVSISIRSNPEGATVFVDGFPTGEVTPCRVDGLSPGQHRILVSKIGYLPAEEVIRIPGGARTGGTITCTLRKYISGDLFVESTAPDAKIYLYGRYTGEKAPHTFPGMSIGTYEVRIVSENASKTVWDVLVAPGETTRCRAVLAE